MKNIGLGIMVLAFVIGGLTVQGMFSDLFLDSNANDLKRSNLEAQIMQYGILPAMIIGFILYKIGTRKKTPQANA